MSCETQLLNVAFALPPTPDHISSCLTRYLKKIMFILQRMNANFYPYQTDGVRPEGEYLG